MYDAEWIIFNLNFRVGRERSDSGVTMLRLQCWITFLVFYEPCECVLRWWSWNVYEVMSPSLVGLDRFCVTIAFSATFALRNNVKFWLNLLPAVIFPNATAHMCSKFSFPKLFEICYFCNSIHSQLTHSLRFVSLKLIKLKSCNPALLSAASLINSKAEENDYEDIKFYRRLLKDPKFDTLNFLFKGTRSFTCLPFWIYWPINGCRCQSNTSHHLSLEWTTEHYPKLTHQSAGASPFPICNNRY